MYTRGVSMAGITVLVGLIIVLVGLIIVAPLARLVLVLLYKSRGVWAGAEFLDIYLL